MRKLFFLAVMMLSAFVGSAQTKIGYINSDEVIGAMPEFNTAKKEFQEFQESLEKQGQELENEAQIKSEQFIKDSATYSPTMKEIKREELLKLIQRVQNYNNEAQEKLMQLKQQKIGPIQQKALQTIQAVAAENKYTYVIEQSTLLVYPQADNLLPAVKKKLGIKDAPAAAPAAPSKRP